MDDMYVVFYCVIGNSSKIFNCKNFMQQFIYVAIPKLREAAYYIGASGHLWLPIGP